MYCHINKSNGKRYVGITCKKPEQRWQGGSRYEHNAHFSSAIQKYGWDGFDHIIICDGISHKEACELEKRYIKEWNLRDNGFGYNLTDGGEGCCGRILSDETKAKIAAAHIGVCIPHTPEQRKKISIAMTGKPHPYKGGDRKPMTEEHKLKLSDAHKKEVFMFSKSGVFIRAFKSAKDGADFVGLKSCQDITKCCGGKRKSAGGYLWRYTMDDK